MKANRKFKEEEHAVSAVIGVILMVAITVAIAATVYVYVSGMLTPGGTKTPDIAFSFDDTDGSGDNAAGRLWISTVEKTTIPWDDLTIGGTATCGTLWTGNIKTGQHINVTTPGTVTVSYKDVKLYGTWTFT